MQFSVSGVNYRTAEIDVREKLSLGREDILLLIERIMHIPGILEAMALSTCNRVELYCLAEGDHPSIFNQCLCDQLSSELDIESCSYHYVDENAVRHLCRLAAGLESMIIGEPQILGQLKEAYRVGLECHSIHGPLRKLFELVFGIAKQVRSQTRIGWNHVSVPNAAATLAEINCPKLQTKTLLLLGAGEMAEVTAKALKDRGILQLLIANRTFQRAVELSEKMGGTPIMLYELAEYLEQIDIIISAAGGREYILTEVDLSRIMERRTERTMFIVDIAMPRSIEPGVSQIAGVKLFNIDDLKFVADSNAGLRNQEAERAMAIIEGRLPSLMQIFHPQELEGTISFIRGKSEEIRISEYENAMAKLQLAADDQAAIESLTKSLLSRFLNLSIGQLREYASQSQKKP